MNNAKIVKKIIADLQGVLTEATDKLDIISQYGEDTVPVDTATDAIHNLATDYENHIDNLSVEACCYILLKKYQGHTPTNSDVLTFKTATELTLHNDYGVSMDKFN